MNTYIARLLGIVREYDGDKKREKKITQEELGVIFGVSQQQAGNWCREGTMSKDHWPRFKEYFGIDIEKQLKTTGNQLVSNSSGIAQSSGSSVKISGSNFNAGGSVLSEDQELIDMLLKYGNA